MWKLWLDDQVYSGLARRAAPEGFLSADSVESAKDLVRQFGPPEEMSLDHDLGGEDVVSFLHWLEGFVNFERAYGNLLPPPIYRVHSENPVGSKRIISFMETWRKGVGE